MQTISTTDLRAELTSLLQNLDEPLAITKHGKIVAWLISPSHNPVAAPTQASPTIDPFECVASPSITSGLVTNESALDEDEGDDWDLGMEADFERYLSGMVPEDRPLY